MNKLPALQFYPADWRKDPGVQALSYEERGIWFEILCLMHESDDRGRLLLAGRPMPDSALARVLGLDNQILTNTLTKLLDYGVASRDDEGVLINRRMVRDENLRKTRSECGKLGGNPNLLNQNPSKPTTKRQPKSQTPVKQIPTPSSSSSSAFSSSSSSSDFKRLIETCVRENSSIDPRIVEIGMLYTMIQRNGSTDPIRSAKYFQPEIEKVAQASGKLGDKAIDALLERRRQQFAEKQTI